jgi:hypothetical protein
MSPERRCVLDPPGVDARAGQLKDLLSTWYSSDQWIFWKAPVR